MKKINSPYTAAIIGGGFLFEEMDILLPLLQSEDRKTLLREETVNNNLLHINSETSRKRNISEIVRRYFFRTIGRADKLGSGVRNMFKYSRYYGGGKSMFEEKDIFRISVSLDDLFNVAKSELHATNPTTNPTIK